MILQGAFEKSQGIRYEFDRFQQEIGEGGMGVVYKGFKIYEATGNRNNSHYVVQVVLVVF